jgi:molybdopterin molybdotransferase
MDAMLMPREALALTLQNPPRCRSEQLPLHAAVGRVLAKAVVSPVDHPLFDQSAVDGYALKYVVGADGEALKVAGMARAGIQWERFLQPGECYRIFTGAPIPSGADTVVMQELTERFGDLLVVKDRGLRTGANVRRTGEQIVTGALAIPAGDRLNAAAIGFLASLGIEEVEVSARPRIEIIVTGDEFASSEGVHGHGLIFESNGRMLLAALLERSGISANFTTCPDIAESLAAEVDARSRVCDLLILTGGVSVGDYDFSLGALEANGYRVVYHQVAQKPGKPLLFCRSGNSPAFGLPGNPRAALMCFYLYVLPLLDAMEGAARMGLRCLRFRLLHGFKRKPDGKVHFVTGSLRGGGLVILDGQASHLLQSFASADVIVELPADRQEYEIGMELNCYLL